MESETTAFYISGVTIVGGDGSKYFVVLPEVLGGTKEEIPYEKVISVYSDLCGTHTFELDRDFAAKKGWLR